MNREGARRPLAVRSPSRRTRAGRLRPAPALLPVLLLVLVGLPALVLLVRDRWTRVPAGPSRIVLEGAGGGGGAGTRLVRVWEDGSRVVLVDDVDDPRDPAMTAGAGQVLFAGRMPDGRAALFRQDLVTGARETLWSHEGDIRHPVAAADGKIVFLQDVPGPAGAHRWALHALDPGSGVPAARITFHGGSDRRAEVVPDGRIVFGIEDRPGLFAVNWDGTEFDAFHRPPSGGGASGLAPLEPVGWSQANGCLLARSQDGLSSWEIPWRSHLTSIRPLTADGEPGGRPVAPRPEPFFQPTLTDPALAVAELFCLEARGPPAADGTRVPPGSTGDLRVWVGPPPPTIDPTEDSGRWSAPIGLAPDGSFHLKVPPDRPLRLEVLSGSVTRICAKETPLWLRPGEKRGCIGCHEPPGQDPPNRVPRAFDGPPVEVDL